MTYLFPILYIILLAVSIWYIRFFRDSGLPLKMLVFIFVIKAAASVSLNILYRTYYDNQSSDIYNYYRDAGVMYQALKENPSAYFKMLTGINGSDPELKFYYSKMNNWVREFDFDLYNENRTIIRFNALVRLISFGNIDVHAVIMAFLSFWGTIALFRAFYPFLPDKKMMLLASCAFIPSVLLWGSSLLKEGLLIFGIGILFYNLLNMVYGHFKYRQVIAVLLTLYLIWLTKFYVCLSLLPSVISLVVWSLFRYNKPLLVFAMVHLMFFALAVMVKYITPYDAFSIISLKQEAFIKTISFMPNVGSAIQLPLIEPTPAGVIKLFPLAIFNSFFQPLPASVNSLLTAMATAENFAILFFVAIAFIFSNWEKHNLAFVLAGFSFTLILFWICGMTTPVAGALVRYKMPALPFLFISSLFIFDYHKFTTFIQKLLSVKKLIP